VALVATKAPDATVSPPARRLYRRTAKEYSVINLGLIQKFIDAGKLDAAAEITEDALIASGLVRRVDGGLLASG
jgi:large subunit ribosomal protein L15